MSQESRPVRVLHVDDEHDYADMVAAFIEREAARFSVETATNPNKAFSRIIEGEFDCVISDYDMPGRNGIEFLEVVREEYPDLPFILFTGKGSEEVASDAISAGVTDYVQKGSGVDQFMVLTNRVQNAVEKVRAEKETEKIRTHMEAISTIENNALITIDEEGRILFGNPAVETLLGYSPDDFKDGVVTILMPSRHHDEHFAAVEHYLITGERTVNWEDFELEAEHRDGHEFPVSISISEFENDDGFRFVGIIRDNSNRTSMEADLLEREARFRQMAENIEEVVWISDYDIDELLYVNPAYEAVWGRSVESLHENPDSFMEAIHPEDYDRVARALDKQPLGDYDEEYRIFRPDGEVRWIHERAIPVEGDQSDGSLIVGIGSDITERKERELELRRQQGETDQLQELLERALVTSDTYVWDWDIRTHEIKRYPTIEPLFGGLSQEIGGVFDGFVDFVHPGDKNLVHHTIREGLKSGAGFEFECRIKSPGDSWQWIRDRAMVETHQGEPIRAIGSVTDITEQKEREIMLEKLVYRSGTLIDSTTREEAANLVVNIASDVLNAPLVAVYQAANGARNLELVAARNRAREAYEAPELSDSEPVDSVSELLWHVFESGASQYINDITKYGTISEQPAARATIVHPLGDHGVFIISAEERDAFTDTDQNFIELLAKIATSVLDRVERESRLQDRESELERFETMVSASGDPLYTLDEQGCFTAVNEALVEITGYDEVSLLGEHASEIMTTGSIERGEAVIQSLLESNQDRGTLEMTLITASEERIPCENHIAILPFDVDFRGTVGVIRDLSDRVEREQRLKRERDRLDGFAGIVSHDLRNPLNVAQGRLQLLSEEFESSHIEPMDSALNRMEALIDNLLSLARAGEDVGDTKPVNLPKLVEACWASVRTDSADLVLQTDATILADNTRLQQLLENLIRNSVEHGSPNPPDIVPGDEDTESDENQLRVIVGDIESGFYVEDNGPGIPKDVREDVFEAGYSSMSGGTGFGLSIVQEVAEAHGWRVVIDASSDGGTRFEFTDVERP